MFDRAAAAGLAHQRDQAEVGEPADVIRGHAQRRVELFGEFTRAGLPLAQHLVDAGAQRVRERLAEALILDGVVRAQAFVPLSDTPYVRARGKEGHLSGEPKGGPLNERPALSIWFK
jgi:hypothetical protein